MLNRNMFCELEPNLKLKQIKYDKNWKIEFYSDKKYDVKLKFNLWQKFQEF